MTAKDEHKREKKKRRRARKKRKGKSGYARWQYEALLNHYIRKSK